MEPKTFLVIDSDRNNASQVEKILAPYGEVAIALDPEEFKRLVSVKQPNVIFISSELNNVETNCEGIRASCPTAVLYVIGSYPLSKMASLFAAGVKNLLPMPFDPELEFGPPPVKTIGQAQQIITPAQPAWLDSNRSAFQTSSIPDNQITNLKPEPRSFSKDEVSAEARIGTLNHPFQGTPSTSMELESKRIPHRSNTRIVIVVSNKGGQGTSYTAAQLATFFARKGNDTILMDADKNGNAARIFGLDTMHSILDFDPRDNVISNYSQMDLEEKLLVHKPTGLRILPSPLRTYDPVSYDTLKTAIEAYKPMYSHIVIDLPQGYTGLFEVAKEYATDIVFVCLPDSDRLESVQDMAILITEKGIDKDKICVVANMISNKDDVRRIKVTLNEFGFQIFPLPFSDAFKNRSKEDPLPLFSKSSYSDAFFTFLEKGMDCEVPKRTPGAVKTDVKNPLKGLLNRFKRK